MRVLITGTLMGLGYELTKEGLNRGHEIIATQLKMNEEIKSLLASYPDKLTVELMDVTSDDSVAKAAASVSGRSGSIDGLINNAAVLLETKYFDGDPVVDMDLSKYYKTMEVNINGVVRVCKAFTPLIYSGGADRFVMNITSEGAKLNTSGYIYPAYSVSKYALNMYTQIMRNYFEEKQKNVRVFMIHPGRMQTVMGVENAQIEPGESARGIWDILEKKTGIEREDIPFVNYKGTYMG